MRIYIENKRMMKCLTGLLIVGWAVAASSCVSSRRVNYLQDMTQNSQIELENRFEARIAPYDELTISVSSSQLNQEMAKPFNSGTGGGRYLVDVNGDIDFPVLGTLHVAGLTRLRLQDTIASMLARGGLLDEPFVSARFSNFKIFFLGNGTGKVITIPNERCTFLEALAMNGGLDNYTRRDRIAVMREVDGRMTLRYLDPRSSEVFYDPFFMLQQNDFIITDGMNSGVLRSEATYWSTWVSSLLSIVSVASSILLYRTMISQKQ